MCVAVSITYLKFSFIEQLKEILGHKLVKALHESTKLGFNVAVETVLDNKVNVLLQRDGNVKK